LTGIRIKFHWLFALILVVSAGAGYLLEALILLGSLAAHELAHLAVAWVLGVRVEDLLVTPFGGMIRLDSALEADPQAETSVALAGPFQSFFLASLALAFNGSSLWDQELVRFFFEVNANLAMFNLIPALPLDGGRALRGLLAQRWGYRRVTGWMVWSGRVCGLAMATTAVLVLSARGQVYATPLVGGLFLSLTAGREVSDVAFRSYQRFLRKRKQLSGQRILSAGQLVAQATTRLGEVVEYLGARRYHLLLVVDEDLRPIGTLHEAELLDAFAELGPRVTLSEVLDR
jgi:stage IV sporulation protein FB